MRIEGRMLREILVSQPREVHKVHQRMIGKLDTQPKVLRDQVILSDQAQLFLRVREALTNLPEVREHLVMALRQEIEAGTYQINEEALIDALLGRPPAGEE